MCFGVFLVACSPHAVVRCPFVLNTCHRYDSDTCQLSDCTSSEADECVHEVVMFQTIRLPVLIGLPLFLSTCGDMQPTAVCNDVH